MMAHRVILCTVFAFLPILGSLGKTIPEDTPISATAPVVTIPDGKIIGTDDVTVDKQSPYHAFKGIPYAQPPIGNLRFASPVKNSNWAGYWDATNDAEICVQGTGDAVVGSEDCLYINVYTPNLENSSLPVMVWIYGGAFSTGNSGYNAFGPDYFLDDGEVIFVSFNYRTGILGFLSTEDTTASGNWGLKDQVLALKWVKENIQYFGGDPTKITIFGESAGGASVSYLLQIPKAQGLFDAAIIQSGTSETLWALSTRARQAAFQVALGLGIPTLLGGTLVSRLRNVEAYRLQRQAVNTSNTIFLLNPLRGLVFAPVVEVDHDDAVFTKSSDDYFRSGQYPNKVPVLIGYNSNEAGFAKGIAETFQQYLLLFDIISNTLSPFSLSSITTIRNLAANEIRLFYFGINSISSQPEQAVKFINTDQFNRGTIRTALNMASFANVYLYIFGYEGQIIGNVTYSGVAHGDDLVYLFRSYTEVYTELDLEVRAKLIRLWTNFAKTFNPTPIIDPLLDNVIWPAINPGSADIDFAWLNSTISLDKNPDDASWKFYDTIFSNFGDNSYTTY